VEEFEEKLSAYLQNPYVLTLNSATSGLQLALHMLKKPSGAWPGWGLYRLNPVDPSIDEGLLSSRRGIA
jgi:hypothetical protein